MVRYGVDAVRMKPYTIQNLEKSRREGVMDRVFFNFPHVGGKTKDVNRQVRYNQGLFFPSFFVRFSNFTRISADVYGQIRTASLILQKFSTVTLAQTREFDHCYAI